MILSNLAWGRISDRKGNRQLLQITGVLGVSMPLMALALGLLAARMPVILPWLSWAYAVVFVASGALMGGVNIASPGYLLDIAPPAQRPLYLGFTNTLYGIARFATLMGGLIVDWAGFTVLLVISACFYGLALALSLTMVEPRAAENPLPLLSGELSKNQAQ